MRKENRKQFAFAGMDSITRVVSPQDYLNYPNIVWRDLDALGISPQTTLVQYTADVV